MRVMLATNSVLLVVLMALLAFYAHELGETREALALAEYEIALDNRIFTGVGLMVLDAHGNLFAQPPELWCHRQKGQEL